MPGSPAPDRPAEFVDEVLLDDPEQGLRWLRISAAGPVLLSLLGAGPVSHEMLDEAVEHLGRPREDAERTGDDIDHRRSVARLRGCCHIRRAAVKEARP